LGKPEFREVCEKMPGGSGRKHKGISIRYPYKERYLTDPVLTIPCPHLQPEVNHANMVDMNKIDVFTELYRDHFPLVYNTIYAKVESIEITEDLCQEVFIVMFNKLDEIENPRAWLLGTLRNTVMRYFRDKKPQLDIDTMFDDHSLAYVNGFRDTRLLLKDALDQATTTDEERMMVDLIAYNCYSYEFAARAMGLTVKTVRYRYNRVVQRVMEFLRQKGINGIEELL
jgi:RNA polymerase sigma factor (sigma-70 family)